MKTRPDFYKQKLSGKLAVCAILIGFSLLAFTNNAFAGEWTVSYDDDDAGAVLVNFVADLTSGLPGSLSIASTPSTNWSLGISGLAAANLLTIGPFGSAQHILPGDANETGAGGVLNFPSFALAFVPGVNPIYQGVSEGRIEVVHSGTVDHYDSGFMTFTVRGDEVAPNVFGTATSATATYSIKHSPTSSVTEAVPEIPSAATIPILGLLMAGVFLLRKRVVSSSSLTS